MNRKGDIPTYLLIPVTLVLVTLTLLSLYGFGKGVGEKSQGISDVTSEINFAEFYVRAEVALIVKQSLNCGSKCEISDIRSKIVDLSKELTISENPNYAGAGNVFSSLREGKFEIRKDASGKYLFVMDGIFVKVVSGKNSIRRDFSISESFDAGS